MSNFYKFKLPLSLCVIFALSGCASLDVAKEKVGTVTGALVGGIAASKVAGKAKGAWTFVGATAGAFIGNTIGKYLDNKDKEKMSVSTKETIATGNNSSWKNADNNTSGSTTELNRKSENTAVNVKVLKGRVEKVPPLEMIGARYQAKAASNVRGGPGTDYKIVGNLDKQTVVNVIGKVRGQSWYLISEGGIGSGFVATSLLEITDGSSADDELGNAASNNAAEIEEQEIVVERICRTVEQSVTLADGSVRQDQIKACQGPNGWEIQENA